MRPQPVIKDVQRGSGSGSGGEVGLIDQVQKQASGASLKPETLCCSDTTDRLFVLVSLVAPVCSEAKRVGR